MDVVEWQGLEDFGIYPEEEEPPARVERAEGLPVETVAFLIASVIFWGVMIGGAFLWWVAFEK